MEGSLVSVAGEGDAEGKECASAWEEPEAVRTWVCVAVREKISVAGAGGGALRQGS